MSTNINNVKLFKATEELIIPNGGGRDGRNYAIGFVSENDFFSKTYRFMNIKRSYVKDMLLPTLGKLKISTEYVKVLRQHGLLVKVQPISDHGSFTGKNFFVDYSYFVNSMVSRRNVENYGAVNAIGIMDSIKSLNGFSANLFNRVLIYSVNLNGDIPEEFRRRKAFYIYKDILFRMKSNQPMFYDMMFLHLFGRDGGRYVLLYDVGRKNNLGRIKQFLTGIEPISEEESRESSIEKFADEISSDLVGNGIISPEEKGKIETSIVNYIGASGKMPESFFDRQHRLHVLTNSIFYSVTGDIDRSGKATDKLFGNETDIEKLEVLAKRVVKNYRKDLVERTKTDTYAVNNLVKYSDPLNLVDGQVPSQIINKRFRDFNEVLREDLVNVFKPLENEEVPIYVKEMDVKTISSKSNELSPTIKDRYNITLLDGEGNEHKVSIDLPHLTDNGTFLINGIQNVLVNQLITNCIYFFKPYFGKFQSNYSTLTLYSRKLSKYSYLMCYIAGYKIPLIMFMAYKYGFDDTMKLFGVDYGYVDDKSDDVYNIRLPDGRYIQFYPKTTEAEELIDSFRHSLPSFPERNVYDKTELNSDAFWRQCLVKEVGNRNCIYKLDQVWKFIVTPVEESILKAKGDPTTLPGIVKYIAERVVQGYVDDRNSLDKQRVRTSEVFTHAIQKQVLSAYNEFLSKKLGGDTDARMEIKSSKAYSDVINSQNVQMLECINPMEELSMMTRITPVGIGGIPDKRALPQTSMNIHGTYMGNIDPLETPDSASCGILQHLACGAAISNVRGMFAAKDQDKVVPAGMLSVGPAMVPFVESNDGCRVIMGTGQTKQAIPLVNPEYPAVQTGYESLLTPLLSDNFIKKCPTDGEVVNVDINVIIIRDKYGIDHPVDTSPRLLKSGSGISGLGKFKHTVKVGQKVKKGQLISEGANIRDGMISNGINALVALMPWDGYNFEDGIVVSASLAKKFVSSHIDLIEAYIEEDDEVVFVADVDKEYKKGDVLLTYTKAAYDVESFKHVRSPGGKITYVEIFVNTLEDKIPDKLKDMYEQFAYEYATVHGNYPIGEFQIKKQKFEGILVKFTLEQQLPLGKGDKLNNRHGNKGVVAIVERDEDMPLAPWGERIEIILSPLGVVNRMNNGQLFELYCGLISKTLAKLIVTGTRKQFMSVYSKTLDILDGTPNKEYSRKLISKLNSLTDKAYDEIVTKTKETKIVPLIFPPFKTPKRDNILMALDLLGLKPKYSVKLPKHDNHKTDETVPIGYTFVQKLEHMSEKKLSSRGIGPYVSKTMTPTAGKSRKGGQKVGEGDLYGLLSWDCPIVIDELFGSMSSDHATKSEMVSEIIQTGKTSFRPARTNPEKDMFSQMMLAIHLTGE